jgi:plastocyanin
MRTTIQREDSGKKIGFSPQSQSAEVGDTMFWFNEDKVEKHQVFCDTNNVLWGAVIEPQNSSQLVTLDTANTYEYHCVFHPDETGTIEVS